MATARKHAEEQTEYVRKWSARVLAPSYSEDCKLANVMTNTLMQMTVLERLTKDQPSLFHHDIISEFQQACEHVRSIREQLWGDAKGKRQVPDLSKEMIDMLVAKMPKAQ